MIERKRHTVSEALRKNSDTLGKVAELPRSTRSTFERVEIEVVQEARLSSLRSHKKVDLLTTYLMDRCGIKGDMCVRYSWQGRIKSITVGAVEYQERGGSVMKFDRGVK